MKQHEDIIKEIRELIKENSLEDTSRCPSPTSEKFYEDQPRDWICSPEYILSKLDQLEQEQKDVEVIENTGKEHWNKERGIITKPEGIEIKTKLYEQDIDKIIVVKRSK